MHQLVTTNQSYQEVPSQSLATGNSQLGHLWDSQNENENESEEEGEYHSEEDHINTDDIRSCGEEIVDVVQVVAEDDQNSAEKSVQKQVEKEAIHVMDPY